MTEKKQPNLIKTFDKRTGNTYFYESVAYWDSEKKQSRTKRKLVGKLNPETGKMVPTDGRKDKAFAEKLAYAGYFVLLSNSRMTSAQVPKYSVITETKIKLKKPS